MTARAACRTCGHAWEPFVRRARFRGRTCPACAGPDVAETEVLDRISADSPFADRSLAALGLPPGHVHEIVDENAGGFAHRFVEVTGDLSEGGIVC